MCQGVNVSHGLLLIFIPVLPAQSWIAARENTMILLLQVCSDCLCFASEETQGGAVPVVANVE